MGGDDAFEPRRPVDQPDAVHEADAAAERWMMQSDQGRAAGSHREGFVEPVERVVREPAGARQGQIGREADHPQRREIADAAQRRRRMRAFRPQVAKKHREFAIVVMVPGDGNHRATKPSEQSGRPRVRLRLALVGDVAGEDHEIRPGFDVEQRLETVVQRSIQIDRTAGGRPRRGDVEIAEMGNEHGVDRPLRGRRRGKKRATFNCHATRTAIDSAPPCPPGRAGKS